MSALFVVEFRVSLEMWMPVVDLLGVVLASEQLTKADRWMVDLKGENPNDIYRIARYERKRS